MQQIHNLETGLSKLRTRVTSSIFAMSLATVGLAVGMPMSAHAAVATTTITPTNFNTTFDRTDVRPVSSYDFVTGPSTPPLGIGSLELNTTDGAGKQQHLETQQAGTPLANVDAMGYSTYRQTASTALASQTTAINMEVSTNGDGTGYTTLVFEPVYNLDQGTVTEGTWQNWDAYKGGDAIWWSSRAIPGVCASSCYVSWSAIVAANPNATILSYGVNQGSGNSGLIVNVDALSIGVNGNTTTYDFEPYVVARDKAACKSNNWKTMTDASGKKFKNQGDCVSYVATHGKNKASGSPTTY